MESHSKHYRVIVLGTFQLLILARTCYFTSFHLPRTLSQAAVNKSSSFLIHPISPLTLTLSTNALLQGLCSCLN
jgi:hypothetical protein